MNKREFVLASGGALVASGSWSAGLPSSSEFQIHTASDGNIGYWRGRVGERFDVFGARLPSHLVLQRVDEHLVDPHTSQFSLLFEAAGADSRGTALLRADFCQLA